MPVVGRGLPFEEMMCFLFLAIPPLFIMARTRFMVKVVAKIKAVQ